MNRLASGVSWKRSTDQRIQGIIAMVHERFGDTPAEAIGPARAAMAPPTAAAGALTRRRSHTQVPIAMIADGAATQKLNPRTGGASTRTIVAGSRKK